jgi:soluble lytic murein transglycosylase
MMSSMRKAALLLLPTVIGTAALASTQSSTTERKPAGPDAATVAAAQYAAARAQPHYAVSDIDNAITSWRRLRQSSGYSFGDYARFLIYNPGWPGEDKMRRDAERAMRVGEHGPTVIAFFAHQKPLTGNGFANYALALSAAGRHAEALAAARQAWGMPELGANAEVALYSRFGAYFTRADHDRRADALLFDKDAHNAHRFLAMVSPARRAAFAARIAMQSRAPNAESLFSAVAGQIDTDAGLLMDRLRYYRDAGSETAARQLAARPHAFVHKPADPERFLDMLLILAGGAADDRQWSYAYNIARQVDDILPAGAVVNDQPYGYRDKYTSLTWLGGSVAFGRLNNPANAIGLFERYARGGKSAQVETKGLYWAGRAAIAAGKLGDSLNYFNRAATYPELFYGQLALERMGRSVPTPNPLPTFAVTNAQRAGFAGRRLVQATRRLDQLGYRNETALFVRALSESLTNDAERVMAIEFGRQIGRQDMAVWVARTARNNGGAFYVREAFPTLAAGVPGGEMWSLTHGITRQESSFDRSAVSHAGARGLMQLMPGTAREQAGKMGYSYDAGRLTSDPNYNVMLGSAYFRRMMNMWDGNVPLAVASYNAGYGNVRKWVERYGDPRRPGTDVLGWIEQIPFSETRGYVQRVIENSVVYDQLNPHRPSNSSVHVSRYLGRNRPA